MSDAAEPAGPVEEDRGAFLLGRMRVRPRTGEEPLRDGARPIEPARQAQVYVFALLAHTDKATLDPLDASQWRFFVLATAKLNARTRSQHSITLPTLAKLTPERRFEDLRAAVKDAAPSVAA